MSDYRIEKDSMGEMRVPANAYYGAQTARAVDNFPISGLRFSRRFIQALGYIKAAAARANTQLRLLDPKLSKAIETAALEVAAGKFDGEFVVDIFQTGSGTSTNMNANEVIAARAIELLGGARGDKSLVHPNDHVNMGQSTNDVFPTAIHVAAMAAVETHAVPAMRQLAEAFHAKLAHGHPLYISAALEEVRLFGGFKALGEKVARLAGDAVGLFQQVIERVEKDLAAYPGLVRDFLTLLACLRKPMTPAAFQVLLQPHAPCPAGGPAAPTRLPDLIWTRLFLAFRFYLFERGGMIDFFHGQFQTAVEQFQLRQNLLSLKQGGNYGSYRR